MSETSDASRCLIQPPPSVLSVADKLKATVDLLAEGARLRGNHRRRGHRDMPADAGEAFSSAREIFLGIDVDACRRFWFDAPAAFAAADPNTAPLNQGTDPAVLVGRMSSALVREVFSKDRWRCRYCGLRVIQPAVALRLRHALAELVPWGPTNDDKHAALLILRASPDHVVPRSRRGRDDVANLVTACYPCQFKKADSTLAELGLSDPRGYEVDESTDWDGLAGRSIEVAPAVEGLELHWWDTRMGPQPA